MTLRYEIVTFLVVLILSWPGYKAVKRLLTYPEDLGALALLGMTITVIYLFCFVITLGQIILDIWPPR